MPAYDFRCKNCDDKFTVRISITERDQVKCPKCSSSSLQQVFTPLAVKIKSGNSSGCDLSCGANKKFG